MDKTESASTSWGWTHHIPGKVYSNFFPGREENRRIVQKGPPIDHCILARATVNDALSV